MAPPSVLAEIATEQQRVTAEIRELDLLIESTQTEVNRLKSREDQMKAKVEEVRKNPGNFQREEIFGATDDHAAAMARRMTMEGQLNSLQSKRKLIDRSAQILATAQRQLAEYSAPRFRPTPRRSSTRVGSFKPSSIRRKRSGSASPGRSTTGRRRRWRTSSSSPRSASGS